MKVLPLLFALTVVSVGCAHSPSSDQRHTASTERKGLLQLEEALATKTNSRESNAEQTCKLPSTSHLSKVLALAAPENFTGTRYRKGPRTNRIEKETDCSRFVHEIYRRAGMNYHFRSSRELKNAPEFEQLAENEARAGDLMLFRGHVGIVDESGQIISATKLHSRKQKSAITRQPKENFPGIRGKRIVLRYKCQDALLVSENTK